jgi:alkylhydroperoxidase family enzyme
MTTRRGRASTELPRRKNFKLRQSQIDRARAALGAVTDTETIERALDAVVDLAAFRAETDQALADLVGAGGVANYFDPVARTRRPRIAAAARAR